MTEIVKMMAAKLGYRDDVRVIGKACEQERLLKLRMSGSTALSDSARAVICLDLAAETFGLLFDLEQGLKLAAVKKSSYKKSRHTVCKLLGVEENNSIGSLCVRLGCPDAKELSEHILQRFKDTDVKESDLTHPQFACMAVYQACRVEKLKVTKSKFVSQSHLKPSQWNELEAEWNKMAQDLTLGRPGRGLARTNKTAIEVMSEKYSELTDSNKKSSHNLETDAIEDYDLWKSRILQQAYAELNIKPREGDVTTIHLMNMQLKNLPKIDRQKGIRLVF